jgi:hypothetical protein
MSPIKDPKPKKQRPPPTPKQPHLWDQPPPPKTGDAKDEITFAAVGRSLSAWERLEAALSQVFAGFLGARGNNLPAMRAYVRY